MIHRLQFILGKRYGCRRSLKTQIIKGVQYWLMESVCKNGHGVPKWLVASNVVRNQSCLLCATQKSGLAKRLEFVSSEVMT